jgi:hypothetical protein
MSNIVVETHTAAEVDLDQHNDQELIAELLRRGYCCFNGNAFDFESQDWQMLLHLIDQVPQTWEIRRLRDKVFAARNSS